MMYLEEHIGKFVYISITEQARKTVILNLFYESKNHEDLISNKLLGVDPNGIWIEGLKKFRRLADENNNPIPIEEQIEEDGQYSVFIHWNYIDGIFVDQSTMKSKIGF